MWNHHDAFDVLWSYLVVADAPRPSDLIFCFGSHDHTVPRRAADLYRAGVARWVLVSGGVPYDDDRSEAVAFADGLISCGVPATRIIVEEMSCNTGENVTMGMAAARSVVPVRQVTAVAWPLASRRCRATFGRWFPGVAVDVAGLGSGTDSPRRWPANERTFRAALGEYERLNRYGDLGWVRKQDVPDAVHEAARILYESTARSDAMVAIA